MLAHVDNRITYNGNGNATEFAYQFKILDRTDIKVLLTDADGKEKLLTKDYYVDVEKSVVRYPGYAVGAEVPESERPPVLPTGWKLTIYREVPVTQETDLPDQYPFNQVEDIGDKLTMIAQQLTDVTSRSLKISVSKSTDIDTTIPFEAGKSFRIADDGKSIVLTEAPGKVIDEAKGLLTETTIKAEETATNAQEAKQANAEIKTIYNNGSLTPIANLDGSIGTALKRWGYIFANKVFAMNLPIVYKSVAEMKADSLLSAGMTACTLGYYSPNDGGAGTYIIRAKADGDVDDGGSVHELGRGLVAELVVENGTVNVKQFGARGDGVTDDTDAIQYAINSNEFIVIPYAIYIVSKGILIYSNRTIIGDGYPVIKAGNTGATGFPFVTIVDSEDIRVVGLTFDGDITNKELTHAQSGIHINGSNNVVLEDITIKNCGRNIGIPSGNGFSINATNSRDAYNNKITNCTVLDDNCFLSFGFRLYTSWEGEQTTYCKHNTIDHCALTGCHWNGIEIAGPMTLYNNVNCVNGYNVRALTFIECDKGASYNTISDCVVDNYIGNNYEELVIYRSQGEPLETGTIFANGNVIRNCIAILSEKTSKNIVTGMYIRYAKNTVLDNLMIKCPDSFKTTNEVRCIHVEYSENAIITNCILNYNNTNASTTLGVLCNQDCFNLSIRNCIFNQNAKGRALQCTRDIFNISFCENKILNGQLAIYFPTNNTVADGIIASNVFKGQTFKSIGLHSTGVKFKGLICNNLFENITTPITADDPATFTDVNNVSISL